VIGQNSTSIGVRTVGGSPFGTANINDTISTLDRSVNISLPQVISISASNTSSPGDLAPDTLDSTDVRIAELDNQTDISIITDVIGNFLSVPLNSGDFGMSGPGAETLSTSIEDAFEFTTYTVGSIKSFANLNPGADYINDVFVIAEDDFVKSLELKNQILSVLSIPPQLNIGDIVEEDSTSRRGIVRAIDATGKSITVTPYSYQGFSDISADNNDTVLTRLTDAGGTFVVTSISTDFGSKSLGDNATITARTEFAIGKITNAAVVNSGFGYNTADEISLVKGTAVQARGLAVAETQGKTAGFWGSLSSHLNGFIVDESDPTNADLQQYYDSNMRIQDSNFFQEYSYQIKSMLGKDQYEELLKQNVHLAGTKLFGQFSYKQKAGGGTKQRFLRVFNDDGISQSPLE
jgi:hypothetical protein